MIEEWKPIEGYNGYYEVSNTGFIRSVDRIQVMKNGHTRKKTSVMRKTGLNYVGGYKHTSLSRDGVHINVYIHRIVAQHFVSNPDNKPEVNHKDGNKLNNHYTNLEWVTPRENQIHAHLNGLKPNTRFGETAGQSKLKEKDVLEIIDLLANTQISQKEIARRYNIHYTAIVNINGGHHWKHIKRNIPSRQLHLSQKGKVCSQETKEKLSRAKKGKKMPSQAGGLNPLARKVRCIETGETFQCIKEAAEFYGSTRSQLSTVLRGRRKRFKGLHWEYIQENQDK